MQKPNAITILNEKRRSLVNQKVQRKREYEQQIAQIDEEIMQIDSAIKTVESVADQYRCKACGGSGRRFTSDAAGSREEQTCEHCNGTGYNFTLSL